jgi:hypothetical protein
VKNMSIKTTDVLMADMQKTSLLAKRIMWIFWPSFLMAGVLEMLVFAMINPEDLHWFGKAVQLSHQGIYTISFFVFWLVTVLSSALTAFLAIPPSDVNH